MTTNTPLQNDWDTAHKSIIRSSQSYLEYKVRVEEFCTIQEQIALTSNCIIAAYNQNPSLPKLWQLQETVPTNFKALRRQISSKICEFNTFDTAQHWVFDQLTSVLPATIDKKWSILNLIKKPLFSYYKQARLAQKKQELLYEPNEVVASYFRNYHPSYYKQFLESCQVAPSLRLHALLIQNSSMPLSEESFFNQKQQNAYEAV